MSDISTSVHHSLFLPWEWDEQEGSRTQTPLYYDDDDSNSLVTLEDAVDAVCGAINRQEFYLCSGKSCSTCPFVKTCKK